MTDQIYKGMHDVYLQACACFLPASVQMIAQTLHAAAVGEFKSSHSYSAGMHPGIWGKCSWCHWECTSALGKRGNIHLHHRSQLFSVNAWHWFISRCREISRIRINIELFVLQTSGNQIKSQMKEIKGKVSIFYTSCLLIYLKINSGFSFITHWLSIGCIRYFFM